MKNHRSVKNKNGTRCGRVQERKLITEVESDRHIRITTFQYFLETLLNDHLHQFYHKDVLGHHPPEFPKVINICNATGSGFMYPL